MRAAIRKVIALDFGRRQQLLPAGTPTAELHGLALLVTRDNLSLQWAPRWLQHTGLEIRIAGTAKEALEMAGAEAPRLVLADASLVLDDGASLLTTLRSHHGDELTIFALCNSNADVALATESNATDIMRRPYDWDLISRRAIRAIRAEEMHVRLRDAQEHMDRMESTVMAVERERAKAVGLDALTQLPNGERLRSLLQRAIGTPEHSTGDVGVLVIGLDRFRVVNEAVGRQNANGLIRMFAERLRACLADREVIGGADGGAITAVAARLGGVRFAMMMSNARTEEIVRVREAIQEQLEQPFEIAGQSIYLTASVGAAIFPRDNSTADGLIQCAETAMREAQDSGAGFEFFTRPTDSSSLRLLALDRMLREAIHNGDLELAYQPITAADSGAVVGAEALLRWHHAEEGTISPADFVPVAEKTGLMREIGDFVIAEACAQLREWLDAGVPPIRMAVNLSLCQLLRGDVIAVIEQALEANDLRPEWLEIELSERGVLNQRPEVVAEIRRLKTLGVRISIDDFGTGQAAISYLKDLPVDVIKIDRSYVSGAANSDRSRAIASGMVALARRLEATVIAEGVETPEQLDMLRSWGSHECQGFLFSPAVPAADFLAKFG